MKLQLYPQMNVKIKIGFIFFLGAMLTPKVQAIDIIGCKGTPAELVRPSQYDAMDPQQVDVQESFGGLFIVTRKNPIFTDCNAILQKYGPIQPLYYSVNELDYQCDYNTDQSDSKNITTLVSTEDRGIYLFNFKLRLSQEDCDIDLDDQDNNRDIKIEIREVIKEYYSL